jgi:hypothetical protein
MNDLGKLPVIVGVVLVIAASAIEGSGRLASFLGAVIWKTGGLGGLGRLPGDITVHKGHSTFRFPIITCLPISAVRNAHRTCG